MPEKDSKALFSEDQVKRIADAEIAKEKLQWQLKKQEEDRQLEDSPPQTVLIDRKIALSKFKEMEKEILDKHKQATIAWRKAYSLYSDILKKNPRANIMNPPGKAPELGTGIEDLRGVIRAYESLTEEKIRISRSEWMQTFKNASQAIASMRQIRDNYSYMVSGATMNLASMNLSSPTNYTISSTG